MKRFAVLLLVLALMGSVCCLASAENEEIGGKYYTYSFYAEGYGDYTFYFHFYETDPVLGSVYYAGLSNNGIRFAGLYSVEKKDYAYACYLDRAAVQADESVKKKETGTAPYTIHFMDWDGNEIDTCGWDGDILYNDCEHIAGAGSGPVYYHLDADGKYQETYDKESGVSYLNFVVADDPTCTVSLNHDKTYADMMMYFIDGNWAIADGENGAKVYTLTPFDETEDTVTLTVAADQKTAVYTDAAGEETEMVNAEANAPVILYQGEGSFHVDAYSTDAAVTLNLFDDETAELLVSVFGKEGTFDTGTYVMNTDHSITFQFDNAGELTAALDMEVRGVVLHYVNENTQLGAMDVALPIQKVEREAPQANVILSLAGGYTTLALYDDNSYEFAYEGAGLKEKGTWTFENYQLTLIREDGTEIPATMDDAHAITITFVAQVNEQLKDTFTCESSVWGPALVK